MLSKSKLMQSLMTIVVLSVALRIEPAKEVILGESKFLGLF